MTKQSSRPSSKKKFMNNGLHVEKSGSDYNLYDQDGHLLTGSGGTTNWGSIGGTLNDQTDLHDKLDEMDNAIGAIEDEIGEETEPGTILYKIAQKSTVTGATATPTTTNVLKGITIDSTVYKVTEGSGSGKEAISVTGSYDSTTDTVKFSVALTSEQLTKMASGEAIMLVTVTIGGIDFVLTGEVFVSGQDQYAFITIGPDFSGAGRGTGFRIFQGSEGTTAGTYDFEGKWYQGNDEFLGYISITNPTLTSRGHYTKTIDMTDSDFTKLINGKAVVMTKYESETGDPLRVGFYPVQKMIGSDLETYGYATAFGMVDGDATFVKYGLSVEYDNTNEQAIFDWSPIDDVRVIEITDTVATGSKIFSVSVNGGTAVEIYNGVDASKISQIDTNTGNISTNTNAIAANATAISNLSTTVSGKQSKITYGTGDPPSSGVDGDVYIKYTE